MARRAKKVKILERLRRSADKTPDRDRRPMTSVTFSADELSALGEYIAAGLVLMRVSTPHRAVSKFKAAMSRLKVAVPRGL